MGAAAHKGEEPCGKDASVHYFLVEGSQKYRGRYRSRREYTVRILFLVEHRLYLATESEGEFSFFSEVVDIGGEGIIFSASISSHKVVNR